jgi:predicted GNAT family acetyltransferase
LSATPLAIVHEPSAHRFVAAVDGGLAYLTYRKLGGRVLELDHTFVPPERRGAGIASQLTAYALEFARERAYRVVPSCPFVAAYIARHPQYRPLVS